MDTPWQAIVTVEEPRLSSRGNVVGSRVSIQTVEEALQGLVPDQARRLAQALIAAAETADEVDETALPHLHAFVAAVTALQHPEEQS